jgi:hypothetical protein
MVGMGGRSCCNHARKIPGYNDFCCGTANSSLRTFAFGIDSAWTHVAVMAAEPAFSKTAPGLLLVRPIPDSFDSFLDIFLLQLMVCLVTSFYIHDLLPHLLTQISFHYNSDITPLRMTHST